MIDEEAPMLNQGLSLSCEECGPAERFSSPETAMFHVLFRHGHFFCAVCRSTMRTEEEKHAHEQIAHAGQAFVCPSCSHEFSSEVERVRHSFEAHASFDCPFCR